VINCYAQNTEDTERIRFSEQDYVYRMMDPSSLSTEGRKLFDMQRGFKHSILPTIQLTNKRISPYFTPYSYSFDSHMEGVIIKGGYGSYSFTDYLSTNINLYLSKAYFGNTGMPDFYLNGSVRAELVLKLHDKIQLTGMGQVSLREGFDPKNPSLMGGSNYYGAEIQFKIINNIGVGIGFTNSYYRSKWTKRTYMTPVGYQ
jgi:hypothetical protein